MEEILIKEYKVLEYINKIHSAHGHCYIVGGYVRDFLLGKKSKDIDIEVYNIDFVKLTKLFGDCGTVHANFGILALKGTSAEFAIPRKENKIGRKHVDFEINLDPNMSLKEAACRRDFTINSLMYDMKNKQIIDNYSGYIDLNNKILKHISDKFEEDALRILRGIRFSFQLGFQIHNSTYIKFKYMLNDLKLITPSRKSQEIKKMFNVTPNNFKIGMISFEDVLLKYFNLEKMKKVNQKVIYHPEGNVWEHTKQCMYLVNLNASKYSERDYEILMLCAFLHDIGKISTTDENLSAFGHEKVSFEMAKSILDDIWINKKEKQLILNLILDHMKMHDILNMKPYKILKLLDTYKDDIHMLVEIGAIDNSGRLKKYSDDIILDTYKENFNCLSWLLKLSEAVKEEKKKYDGSYFMNKGYEGKNIKIKQNEHLTEFIKSYMVNYK